ncbi:TetR/AcrR family transcriptional regulator [Streptacidiphilus sp. PB12-B1b]|nr:TetR/AcrR family transcriptional regulator [Streptacidiphilus sp. PB12-B1b]
MTAEERRESVIRAAMVEFAERGYNGTSTQLIADRVGVSQPYLFRIFPSKRAIFEAAARRCMDDIREAFVAASEGLSGEDAREAMSLAYIDLIADRSRLMMQMQMYVSTAAAEAAGDADVGEIVRGMWTDLWDTVTDAAAMTQEETREFFSQGMLINAMVAMGFPPEHRLWQGFNFEDKGH